MSDLESGCADAGYTTPAIAHQLWEDGIQPLFPYTRPNTKSVYSLKGLSNDSPWSLYYHKLNEKSE